MLRGSAVLLAIGLWSAAAHAGTGDDRTGDVRPAAAAILDAAIAHGDTFTLADARAAGLITAPLPLEMPSSIRVWRRGLDGSSASCSGRVDVIPFERYVAGVLPHEWIRSWHEQSLRAGAVAIRTYAAWWVAAGGKYDCADLDDTTASQVYKDERFAVTDAAVEATSGELVVRDGSLVFAEYSAENGDPTDFGVDEPHCAGEDVFGHGRGTCQWGTQRWAQAGRTYDWMMRHYYPGAVVEGAAPVWAATVTGQEARAELVSGEEMVVWIELSNDGNTTWDPTSAFIGTAGPHDRESPFFKADNWASPTRPTGADHAGQGPGTVARFTWAMVAPQVDEPTTFVETFAPVTADGQWFGAEVRWEITVRPASTGGGGGGADEPGDDPDDEGGALRGGCDAGGGAGALGPLAIAVALLGLRRRRDLRPALVAAGAALVLVQLLGCAPDAASERAVARDPLGGDSRLVAIFEELGAARGVEPALLATVGYTQTRLRMASAYADPADPEHSHAGAIGLLGLAEADVARAAALAGVDEALVHTDERASIDAAAALIAEDGLDLRLAEEVRARLAHGWTGKDASGATITVSAMPSLVPGDGLGTVTQALGYPGAHWTPAYSGNFAAGNRGAADINYIVIHTVQGSYAGCISWFQNPDANVSAHYVVRSSDGDLTQMVDDSDVAWHDGCFNSQSIGIEHEGYVQDPDAWYTEAMYLESAKLTAWLADQYGIPKDRAHIMGHGETPDCSDHTDPGSGWDWAHYMDLVTSGGAPVLGAAERGGDHPATMVSGEEAVAWFELENQSNITWGLDATRLGTQEPQDRDSPFFVDGNWLSPSRATGADHSTYAPGTVGRFTFAIRAPEVTETTTFTEAFQLVQEGVAWFGPVVHMTITVEPRDGGGELEGDPEVSSDGDGDGVSGGCSAGGGGAGLLGGLLVMLLGLRYRRR